MPRKSRASLQRVWYNHMGTFGILSTHWLRCYTVEPPWRDNEPFQSCIPEGEYELERFESEIVQRSLPEKLTYRLRGVPDRSNIVLHQGNTKFATQGCICVGAELGVYEQHWAVLRSVPTLARVIHKDETLTHIEIWSHK